MHPFVVILQVKTLIAIVYRPQEKNANNIKRALEFYHYSPFLYGNIWPVAYGQQATQPTLNGYLS